MHIFESRWHDWQLLWLSMVTRVYVYMTWLWLSVVHDYHWSIIVMHLQHTHSVTHAPATYTFCHTCTIDSNSHYQSCHGAPVSITRLPPTTRNTLKHNYSDWLSSFFRIRHKNQDSTYADIMLYPGSLQLLYRGQVICACVWGLFYGDIGLFCGNISLFCERGIWVGSLQLLYRGQVICACVRSLFYGDIGLFCGNIWLFCERGIWVPWLTSNFSTVARLYGRVCEGSFMEI